MSDPQTLPSAGNGKRRLLLLGTGALLLVVSLLFLVYWYTVLRHYQSTDDAYVAGNVIQITPQVNGNVIAIHADDTDQVQRGKVLVQLDPTDAEVALKQAEAELAQAVRQARTLYANDAVLNAGLHQRKADLARAQADVDKASQDLQRRAAVVDTGAVSKEELQHAQAALNDALSARAAASSSLKGVQQQLVSSHAQTEGTSAATHPTVQTAAAHVREAYLARARCDIVAPADGQLAKRSVQIGQRIQVGAPLMAIVPLDQLWVDANFKESQLPDMHIGQPVTLHADVYGDKVDYRGHIVGLGAGTGAAFSLLPAQNATGNWIKIVQRIPVRIALEPQQLREHPLRVGLSMQVRVDVKPDASQDSQAPQRTSPVSVTAQMDSEAAAAEVLVQHIISDNLGNGAAVHSKPS